jgi:hypothetical protein
MKRGPYRANPDPLTAAEVLGWFATCRGAKPSEKVCADVAERLDGMSSPQWIAYEAALDAENKRVADWAAEDDQYWDFREVPKALKNLAEAMPKIRQHWDRVADCDDARSARLALAALDTALFSAGRFITLPFGEYTASHRQQPKDWHMPALIILHLVRDALATVRSGQISYVANSSAVKITELALKRFGYVAAKPAIAKHAERWFERYGDPMITNWP